MRAAAAFLVLVASAAPAAAQEPGWTASRSPRGVSAELELSGDARLKAQCDAGTIYLLLHGPGVAGLPDEVMTRGHLEDVPEVGGPWLRWEEGGPLLSRAPARNIRMLLLADRLHLGMGPWPGDPVQVFERDLPEDDAPLLAVLADCDEPASTERDQPPAEAVAAGRDAAMRTSWARYPVGVFPQAAIRAKQSRGEVWLTCVIAAGNVLTDCRVESAFPAGYGFGEAALEAAGRARLISGVEGAHVAFRVAFRMAD